MGAFAIGLLLFRSRLGQLADSRGRKLVLLIGLLVVAIAPASYLFATSIPLLIALRAFHGLSIAAFTTGYSALVTDLSPPKQRGELIGYMSLVNPIGMAIGPALGGFLQEWSCTANRPILGGVFQEWSCYTPLFLASAGIGLIGLFCAIWLRVPKVVSSSEQPPIAPQESPWQLVSSDRLRVPTLLMLMVGLAFGILSTFVPLYIKEAGVQLNAGLFYTAAAITSFSIRLPVGRASDRYGRGRFITLGLLLYTLSMAILWSATSAQAFLIAGAIEGCGGGIFLPMMISLLADRSSPEERGRVFGICITGFDLGIAIAGPTLGFFASSLGYRGLFGLATALTFLALATFISFSSKNLAASFNYALGGGKDIYAIADRPNSSNAT
jgi:MFS family permease